MFSATFFAHCLLAFLSLDASNAFPLLNRQATGTAQLSTPTTLTTVSSTMTPSGPLTQTCVITLTPITDSNGKPAVQEVKNCTVSTNASDGTTAAASSNSATSSSSASSSSAATVASTASAAASKTTYVVPGKSIQVLPVGLGVFAGISALALIVVALVTYERTKYRKAFRQRKLAEQGAAMGYSG
ncbi:hypothetical protein EV360DRAFT_91516 [Lentinula raphanica]|nr:hypothetical protein EV360DRAFT_91516 [Lentinula raphanica]